jgi:hypothetical protein
VDAGKANVARRLGLYVAYGFPERRPSGDVSDSANLVGPRGLLLTYRKRRLVWTTDEPGVFVPGREVPVVRAGGALVALIICWNLGSPEAVREAALNGAVLARNRGTTSVVQGAYKLALSPGIRQVVDAIEVRFVLLVVPGAGVRRPSCPLR